MTLNIKLNPKTEQRLKYLMSRQDNVEHLFQDFISYKISQLEKAIFNIEKDLRKYELKYELASDKFYSKYEDGEFGDKDDYMIWSGIYEMYLENKNELKKLQW